VKLSEVPTVFVIDDDEPACKSVCLLVRSMGLRALPFASAEEFLKGFDSECPGCVITDVRMPGLSGVQLQEVLLQQGIEIPVIVLTAYASTALTVRAMKNGAVTLLDKPYQDNDLWDAVRSALTQDATHRQTSQRMLEVRERFDRLTPKETDVLNLILKGRPNKLIASTLSVSERTVENRRREVFTRTETSSVAELVRLAIEAGWDDAQENGNAGDDGETSN
jgi:two-component system, LuxR family, response regulator FixJ